MPNAKGQKLTPEELEKVRAGMRRWWAEKRRKKNFTNDMILHGFGGALEAAIEVERQEAKARGDVERMIELTIAKSALK